MLAGEVEAAWAPCILWCLNIFRILMSGIALRRAYSSSILLLIFEVGSTLIDIEMLLLASMLLLTLVAFGENEVL